MNRTRTSSHSRCVLSVLTIIAAGASLVPRPCDCSSTSGSGSNVGVLGVKVDVDSVLRIQGRTVASLTAGQRRWIEVEAGVVEVEAQSSLMPAVRLRKTIEIHQAERIKVRFHLRDLAAQYQVSADRMSAIEVLQGLSFRDPGTGLQWTSALSSTDLSWQLADAYCRGLSLAGFDDWRLPSEEELKTVVVPDTGVTFRVLPHFNLGDLDVGVQVWSSTDAAEILTPGDRRSLTGVTMVRDRNPVPLQQRMPPPPAPIVVPGLRAATLDLETGKALSAAKDGPSKHHAFCVRPIAGPTGAERD